jgi:hypothetical protein
MTTTIIRTIAIAAVIATAASTILPVTAAAQGRRGAPAARVPPPNPQFLRCTQFSQRAFNTCVERAQGNMDLKRQCRWRYQNNVSGCRSRYR